MIRRLTTVSALILVCSVLDLRGAPVPQPKSDEELITGQWQLNSAMINGKKETDDIDIIMTFKRGTITVNLGASGEEHKGKYTLNASKNPKEIDLVFDDGPEPGQPIKGIYTLTEKELTLCTSNQAKKGRPVKFESKAGTDVGIVTLHRKKP
jgi:uncharacterized protein (TIGR03067 family)